MALDTFTVKKGRVALRPGGALGDYVLERRLAAGGMAEVWVARGRRAGAPETEVALKVMRDETESDGVRAVWRDELAVNVRLRHENVITVFEGFEEGPWLVQVMELVVGQDLRRLTSSLAEIEPLPLAHALHIGESLARGLAYVHARADPDGRPLRIIHRDVSPQNVMIGQDGGVKLLDFGIARHQARENTTAHNLVKGKAAYMSPEQAQGHPLDQRSDVFSMGIVLWELLSGERLFRGRSPMDSMQQVVLTQVPSLARFKSRAVPASVIELVDRMLARSPEERPQDMARVYRALRGALVREFEPDAFGTRALAEYLAARLSTAPATQTSLLGIPSARTEPDRDPYEPSG